MSHLTLHRTMIFIVAVLACVLALSHAAAVPPLSEFSLVLVLMMMMIDL